MVANTDDIAARVAREMGDPALVDKLARLMPSELTALLLGVYRARDARHRFPEVASRHASVPAFAPSSADARALNEVDALFLEAAHAQGFEPIEISTVVPQGLASLTGIDPNNVLACTRNAEVLADPTAALVLEMVKRRRADSALRPALATSSRVLRMQPLPPGEHYSQHFRLLAMVTSVHDRPSIVNAIVAHFSTWTRLIDAARARGFTLELARLEMAGAPDLHAAVSALMPGAAVVFADDRTQARAYYKDALLRVVVRTPSGDEHAMGDGGVVDWPGRIVGDARERAVTSGFGAELLVKRFALRAPRVR